jgi:Tfp pilus assembly protein PilO
MKTRTLFIIILVASLLAVYGFIGSDYLNQRNQRDDYNSQIDDASATLMLIPQPPADLEVRLAAAQDSLEEAKNTFVLDFTITEIINKILESANQTNVLAIPLQTEPWMQESISGQTYSVLRVYFQITGEYTQLVMFLHELQNGELKTLVIESLMVEAIPGISLLESSERYTLPLTANIKIAIYAATTETE